MSVAAIAVAAVSVVLAAGCGSDDDSPSAESTTTSVPVPLLPPVGDVAEYVPPEALAAIPRAEVEGTPVVALYGDSLVQQSLAYATTIAEHRGYRLVGGGYGGLALCDTLDSLRQSLTDEEPAVVVLAFVGNAISPCILEGGEPASADELADRYQRDAETAIAMADAAGARVVLVAPPRMRKPDRDDVAQAITARWNDIAARNEGVTVVDAAAVLTPDGYTDTLPCASWETATLGCTDGAIVVRQPDGTHLVTPFGMSDYSAGAWRYADALTSAL